LHAVTSVIAIAAAAGPEASSEEQDELLLRHPRLCFANNQQTCFNYLWLLLLHMHAAAIISS
jgi:hypothetical protein